MKKAQMCYFAQAPKYIGDPEDPFEFRPKLCFKVMVIGECSRVALTKINKY